jgi:hypothetical protein
LLRRFPSGALIVAGLASCSSQDNATLQITLGGETTTLTQAPAVTEIVIQAYDTSGNPTTIGSAPASASTIPLQPLSEADTLAFAATGYDEADAAVVFGATIPLLLNDIAGDTVPIFVGRVNQFARAPNVFSGDVRQAPLLAIVQGQFLFVAGGAGVDGGTVPEVEGGLSFTPSDTTELYDFGEFQALQSPPTLPALDGGAAFAPQSLAMTGTVAWLFSQQGGLYYDLSSTQGSAQIQEPAAGVFAGISGGITIPDDLGTQFIIGGTRLTGGPTQTGLEINPNDTSSSTYPDGNVGVLTLSAPRLGAAATWVSGKGVIVLGGSATAAGVEILDPATGSSTGSSMAGSPLAGYAPDPSVGAGASAFADGQHVLLAGGVLPNGQDAGVRIIDLACVTGPCTPTWWTSLPTPLSAVSAWVLSPNTALVIGSEPVTGVTHAYFVTAPTTDGGVSEAAVSDAATSDATADAASATSDAGASTDGAVAATTGPGSVVELLLPTNQDSDGGPGVLRNARAIESPVGTIVVFGGYGVIDSYQPPP